MAHRRWRGRAVHDGRILAAADATIDDQRHIGVQQAKRDLGGVDDRSSIGPPQCAHRQRLTVATQKAQWARGRHGEVHDAIATPPHPPPEPAPRR